MQMSANLTILCVPWKISCLMRRVIEKMASVYWLSQYTEIFRFWVPGVPDATFLRWLCLFDTILIITNVDCIETWLGIQFRVYEHLLLKCHTVPSTILREDLPHDVPTRMQLSSWGKLLSVINFVFISNSRQLVISIAQPTAVCS